MITCDLAIIGGGAAGFFAAIRAAERSTDIKIIIFEQAKSVLNKVRISGGGRCNVTHACYDIAELIEYYPRGKRELRGPFTKFMTYDTIDWFENRGVSLKTEEDGRIFPTTDNSETIIDCLVHTATSLGVHIYTKSKVTNLQPSSKGWIFQIRKGIKVECSRVLMATGGSPASWEMLKEIDIQLILPVPSLFSFEWDQKAMKKLSGISFQQAHLSIPQTALTAQGPLLLTHKGISGPAVLSLSAHGARILYDKAYHFPIHINYLPDSNRAQLKERMDQMRNTSARKHIGSASPVPVPQRFWKTMLMESGIKPETTWANVSRTQQNNLENNLLSHELLIVGKSTNKEEFVTSGGVNLAYVDFKRMESKQMAGLFFAGEVLDIDALTGGFNFQAAWTTGWIAGNSMGEG